MNCEEIRSLLGAYHDGEITDVVRIQEIETHLSECAVCARELETLQAVTGALRDKLGYHEAGDSLQARIRSRTGVQSWEDRGKLKFQPLRWLRSHALVPAFGLALFASGFFLLSGAANSRLETDLIAGHLRSLQANHLFDVPSSDQHTVKPWFQGKLDFSPDVPDLTRVGFSLEGGRLDFMNHRPAAALVYMRGRHVINVFVMHSSTLSGSSESSRDGYNLATWRSGGLDYCAISDVNPTDLESFARDFQVATGPSR